MEPPINIRITASGVELAEIHTQILSRPAESGERALMILDELTRLLTNLAQTHKAKADDKNTIENLQYPITLNVGSEIALDLDPESRFIIYKYITAAFQELYTKYKEDIVTTFGVDANQFAEIQLNEFPRMNVSGDIYTFFESRRGEATLAIKEKELAAAKLANDLFLIKPVEYAAIEAIRKISAPPSSTYITPENIEPPFKTDTNVYFKNDTSAKIKEFLPFVKAPSNAISEWEPIKTYRQLIVDQTQMEDDITQIYTSYISTDPTPWKNKINMLEVFKPIVNNFLDKLNVIETDNYKCADQDAARLNQTKCDEIKRHMEFFNTLIALTLNSDSAQTPLETIISAITPENRKLIKLPLNITNFRTITYFINYYIDYIDGLIPVRTVVNFRTGYPIQADVDTATENFKSLLQINDPTTDINDYSKSENEEKTRFKTITRRINDLSLKYGPFFRVINGGTGLNVAQDMDTMLNYYNNNKQESNFKPKHYTYSAFGYSGSGKSYALIMNQDSVFTRAIKRISENNTDTQKYKIKLCAYDYYGEIKDNGCTAKAYAPRTCDLIDTVPNTETITLFSFATNESVDKKCIHKNIEITPTNSSTIINELKDKIFNSTSNPSNPGYANIIDLDEYAKGMALTGGVLDSAAKFVDNLNDYRRKTNFEADPAGSQKYHIRMTPNNDESSRAHLFIDCYIFVETNENSVKKEALVGKLTIMDMAGSEKVSTIQSDYFSINKFKQYDKSKLEPQIQTLYTTVFDALNTSFTKKDGNFERGYTTGNVIVDNINANVGKVSVSIKNDEVSVYTTSNLLNWIKLFIFLKPNLTPVTQNLLLEFVIFNNAYMISNIINKFNEFESSKKLLETAKLEGFSSIDVNTNKYLTKFITAPNVVKGINILKTDERISSKGAKAKEILNKVINTINGKLATAIANIEKTKMDILESLNIIIEILNKKNNIFKLSNVTTTTIPVVTFDEESLKREFDYTTQPAYIQKDIEQVISQINTMIRENTIKLNTDYTSKLNDFNLEIIQKIHCPIRFQGNFINKTLHTLKIYADALANSNANSDKPRPTPAVLEKIMKHNIYNKTANDYDLDQKFILMTNIRLDFNLKSENNLRKKNYLNALDTSLEFAHCINPFSTKTADGYKTCESIDAQCNDTSLREEDIEDIVAEKEFTDTKLELQNKERIAQDAARNAQLQKLDADKQNRILQAQAAQASKARRRYGGALSTPEDFPHFIQAASLLLVFTLSLFLTERTISKSAPASAPAPVPANILAITFLTFYTLLALLWTSFGVVPFRSFLLHLILLYTSIAPVVTFAPTFFKKKPHLVFLAAFAIALVPFFVSD